MFKFLKYIDFLGDNKKMIDEFGAFLSVFEKKIELSNIYNFYKDLPKKDRTQKKLDQAISMYPSLSTNASAIDKKICNSFERYISLKQISKRENEIERKQLFLQFIKNKKDEDLFIQTLKEAEKSLKKSSQLENAKSKLFDYYIQSEYYFHPSFTKGEGRSYLDQISLINKNIDDFYIISKRKILSERLGIERATSKENSTDLLDSVLQNTEESTFLLSNIYKKDISLTKDYSDELYYQLKQAIYDNAENIELDDLFFLYNSLLNHLAHAHRVFGQEKYLVEYFEVLKKAIRDHILFQFGFLDSNIYMNYVNVACRLNKTTEVKQFVKEYKKRLKNDKREQVFKISMARIHFSDEEYFLALRTLYKKTFREFNLSLMARSLRLVSFYEIFISDDLDMEMDGEDLFIDKEIASYKIFIRRCKKRYNEENQRIIENENLLILVTKMVKNISSKTIKKKLQKELEEKKIVVFRDWIDAKINNLP